MWAGRHFVNVLFLKGQDSGRNVRVCKNKLSYVTNSGRYNFQVFVFSGLIEYAIVNVLARKTNVEKQEKEVNTQKNNGDSILTKETVKTGPETKMSVSFLCLASCVLQGQSNPHATSLMNNKHPS